MLQMETSDLVREALLRAHGLENVRSVLTLGLSQFPSDGLKRLIDKITNGQPVLLTGGISQRNKYG